MKFPVFRQILKNSPMEKAVNNAKQWLEDHKDDPNVQFMHFCPYCGAPLKATNRQERLETLDEHVTCSDVSMKTVYKCSADCGLSECTMWNSSGESYYDFPKGISDEEYDTLWKLRSKIHKTCFGAKINKWPSEALGSYHYKLELESETPDRRKEFPIRFFKNQKIVPVIERTYQFDTFGKALKMIIKIEYRKFVDKNSYQIFTPWWVQLNRCIKETKYNFQNWLKYPTELNVKRLYGEAGFRSHSKKKGIVKIYYNYVIPFIFGKMMGIVYDKNTKN